ncbi:unnamed protein product [Colias eurytheme]|nr:unnamed protein product [Colias eurytheme]
MDVCEDIDVSPGAKEFDLLLISMYRDSPELWDTKAKGYTDKNKRSIALNKITNELKKYDTEFTVEKLKRKINTLRSNFNREHTKVKRSLMSGVMDEVYRPKLWYYNEFEFIADARNTADTEFLMQRTSVSEIEDNSLLIAGSANKIFKKEKTFQNEESLVNNYLKTSDEEIDIIAKSWAFKLKRLNPIQRRFAEKIINDVLFEGEMETLTRDGVICVPTPSNQAMTQATCMSSSSMQYLNSQSPEESYAQIQSPDSHGPVKIRYSSSPCSLPEESSYNPSPSDSFTQIPPDNPGSNGSCTSSIHVNACHGVCSSRNGSKIKRRHHCCSSDRETFCGDLPSNVKKEQE